MFCRTEIDAIYMLYSFFFTKYQYFFTLTVNGQIPRHTDGIEYRHFVPIDTVTTGFSNFPQNGNAEIHVFYGYHRIFYQILGKQLTLDKGGNFFAVLTGYLNLTQYRKINHTFFIDSITGNPLTTISCIISSYSSLSYLLPYIRQIEQLRQLRVTTVYDNRQFITRTNLDFSSRHDFLFAFTGTQILEICNMRRG